MLRLNKRPILFLSVILSVSTISASTLCTLSVNAVEFDDNEVQSMQTSEFVLPDIIDPNDEETADFVGRVYDEESDLNTFVFENSDGSHTMKVYSHPVKYEDDEGKIKDISLELAEEENGSFVTKDNIVRTVFPKNISDGIGISYNELAIDMVPEFGADVSVKKKDDSETVVYAVDDLTSLEYSLTYLGFKEDIVVREYTGQTEFDFMIYTNGLKLSDKDGTITISDETGKVTAMLGDIIIFDADKNRSMDGNMTYSMVRENEEYLLTVHVSEDYLSADTTAYPIRIDPTIEINYENSGSNGIWDVTINSNAGSDHHATSLYIGKRNTYGVSRVLMKLPNVNLHPIHSSMNVLSARIELQDIYPNNDTMRVKCYCYESGWSPITASWTTVPNSKTGPLLSYNDISYSNGLNQVINHRYRFNIKDAVTKWVEALLPDNTCIPNSFSRDTGVLFRTTLPTEASSTEIYKTFASFNRSEYRPSATITYSTSIIKNQYYSKYDPQKFNTGNGLQPIGDGSHAITRDIMYRMNCYGYAFRHIYDNDDNSGYFTILNPANPLGYEQHPGSFALEADMQNVYNVSELTEYTEPETTMFRVENNMLKDATRLGYSLTVYPINGNTNEVDQYGSTSRLIAVVTSNDNYHFYMQHNDGTWSHKLGGDDDVTNLSISTNRVLTNNNIISKAKEANYENGCLKFFVITRPAIIDYPHGYASDGNQVATYYREKAGEYLIDSRTISSSISGKIDFLKDEDCFAFIPELTKKYEIEVSATSVVSISFSIKSETGTILASGNTSNSISITLNANTQYFIYLKGNNGLEYASYSLQIA